MDRKQYKEELQFALSQFHAAMLVIVDEDTNTDLVRCTSMTSGCQNCLSKVMSDTVKNDKVFRHLFINALRENGYTVIHENELKQN